MTRRDGGQRGLSTSRRDSMEHGDANLHALITRWPAVGVNQEEGDTDSDTRKEKRRRRERMAGLSGLSWALSELSKQNRNKRRKKAWAQGFLG